MTIESGVPFKGTPKVHLGIPHMNFWGSPKPRKSLKNGTLQLRAHYFEVFWEKGTPKVHVGNRLIHMEGF